jgi:hypothetical protein
MIHLQNVAEPETSPSGRLEPPVTPRFIGCAKFGDLQSSLMKECPGSSTISSCPWIWSLQEAVYRIPDGNEYRTGLHESSHHATHLNEVEEDDDNKDRHGELESAMFVYRVRKTIIDGVVADSSIVCICLCSGVTEDTITRTLSFIAELTQRITEKALGEGHFGRSQQ